MRRGRAQPSGRVVLHDPGRSLGTEVSSIDWMIPIPLDISNVAIFEMHIDSTTTRTHLIGYLTDLIADCRLSIND